jgi:uncharacterized protein with HEPN domain
VRSDRERLEDIQEAIARIEKHTVGGRQAFEQDELVQMWMVHHLQIIGEACRGLSSDLRDQHPQVPWTQIVGMRNILVHSYFNVDTDVVWSVVEQDLPDLKNNTQAILRSLPSA